MLSNKYGASLTNRLDIIANSIALYIEDDNGVEGVKDIQDIFLNFNDIATVENNKFNDAEIDDFHVPGLYSLIHYLESNYKNINEQSIIKKIKNYLNEDEYIFTKNNITKNINNKNTSTFLNQQYFTNITKKNYTNYVVNKTIKKVPNYINIENNFYYIKKVY